MRKIIAIAIAAIVIGGSMMFLGFLSGGSTSAYIDQMGIHFPKNEKKEYFKGENVKFSNIELDMDYADVTIKKGSEFIITANQIDSTDLDFKIENNTLKISQSQISHKINLGFSTSDCENVTVTIPEEMKIFTMNMATDAGKLSLYDLTSDSIKINGSYGAVNINGCSFGTADLQLDAGSIKAFNTDFGVSSVKIDAGSIDLAEAKVKDLDLSVGAGSAKVQGVILGRTTVNVDSGSAKLDIKGKSEDYSRNLKSDFGSIKVDEGSAMSTTPKADAANSIDAKVSFGTVKIFFE
ncbi:MAG: DUF4097 family beta strand repeat-containing protein [Anaerovoracaceae bacterium]